MKYRIVKKQHNSRMCFTCGLKNEFGLKASFFELENGDLAAVFTPGDGHQGYPGRLHGGVAGAILDETIGRAILINHDNVWGVTAELTTKYLKPIPLNEEIRVLGRITKDTSRLFEGTGEILLKNGEVAAKGFGKYIKMPLDRISEFDEENEEWFLSGKDIPDELEI